MQANHSHLDSSKRHRRSPRLRFRPNLESLEDRIALAGEITSTFDGSDEGWQLEAISVDCLHYECEGVTAVVTQYSAGGHPNGYIQYEFVGDHLGVRPSIEYRLKASDKFVAGLSSIDRATLKFDYQGSLSSDDHWYLVASDGSQLHTTYPGVAAAPPDEAGWQTRTVYCDREAWYVEGGDSTHLDEQHWRQFLAQLVSLEFHGRTSTGIPAGLDSVRLIGEDPPPPSDNKPDLHAMNLEVDEAAQVVNLRYEVGSQPVVGAVNLALAWGNAQAPNREIFQLPLEPDVGQYYADVSFDDLGQRQSGETHLWMNLDPQDVIEEIDESNNQLSVAWPMPDIVVTSIEPIDATHTSFGYSIAGDFVGQTVAFHLYRSADAAWDQQDLPLESMSLSGPALSAGGHTGQFTAALPLNPSLPFVIVVANPTHDPDELSFDNNVQSFRKYVIGVVTHGFTLSGVVSDPNGNGVLDRFVNALLAARYDAVVAFDWAYLSSQAKPNMAVLAGNGMASLVEKRAKLFNGPVDLHFIGHSRGAVVISQALLTLQKHEDNGALPQQIRQGFIKMSMLDPHPARNGSQPWYSASWLAKVPISVLNSNLRMLGKPPVQINPFAGVRPNDSIESATLRFQKLARDPKVQVAANVDYAEVYHQRTSASLFPFGDPESVLNLWGEIPAIKQLNSSTPLIYIDLTNRRWQRGSRIGHTEVLDWYLIKVAPYLARG